MIKVIGRISLGDPDFGHMVGVISPLDELICAAEAAAATANEAEASEGNTLIRLSQKSLWYFSSEYFSNWLKTYEEKKELKKTKDLQSWARTDFYKQKKSQMKQDAKYMAESFMKNEVIASHNSNGFHYSWGDVWSILSGYKSQFLRAIPHEKGLNKAVLWELVALSQEKWVANKLYRRLNK